MAVVDFAYNWALNKCNEKYNNNEKYSIANIRKEFTKLKKEEKFKWLNEVSSKVTQESIRNLDKAFKSFFNKQSKYINFTFYQFFFNLTNHLYIFI